MELLLQKLQTLGPPLLQGAVVTVTITLVSLVIAILLGLSLALLHRKGWRAVNFFITAYVEVFRNTPVLTQLFLIYFGLPYLGYQIPSFLAAVIGLGLNGGAVLTEVFRSGIGAIHFGQREAAAAVGMTPSQVMRLIILPQTWRITLPPIGNYAIALFKDTAVVSAIAAPEIMFFARNLVTSTFETGFIYALVGLLYFALAVPLARLVERLEARQRAWTR
jgi:His/Glu/Gln/Arg/opine family amino acid ABC transporter permease subunit